MLQWYFFLKPILHSCDCFVFQVVAIETTYWTWLNHLAIWGSVAFWLLCWFLYTEFDEEAAPAFSFIEIVPSKLFWFLCVLCVGSVCLAYAAYKVWRLLRSKSGWKLMVNTQILCVKFGNGVPMCRRPGWQPRPDRQSQT